MEKLKLNKERISKLTNKELNSLHGGGTARSTNVGFTCCWCTNGTETFQNDTLCRQSTYDDPNTCPPQQ